ncbi:ABC-2 transporter permease [Bacillus benzoevorans]|uniref:ABC-type transport system involved in multi-copper enzyme maturation permease subunit n=1 Tax=Bacillus benzoevorans TaxID=1456 RepID=A0A7X0LVQ9_9BACI|nr:ABC-2 transporter permease [Bacillus benzoevorans]MBB6444539.1 ABC-type transport system involved in multi-copper enzyme maturation permease subunit [Bacillus benzoevorans]
MLQKKSFAFALLLMLFFSFTLSNLGPTGITIGIITIAYQLGLGASALEDKNNSDIILISLPIKKKTIVLSKYLSIFVYLLYAVLGFSCLYLAVNLFAIPYEIPLTKAGVVSAIASGIIFFSITYPLIFRFGYLKSKMPNFFLFFVLILGGTAAAVNLFYNEQSVLGQKLAQFLEGAGAMFTVIFLFGLAIIWTVSYLISLRFYTKREF